MQCTFCSFKGEINYSLGGEMLQFRYVAVNQGFTHKIDTPALCDLQYQKCYLFMFDHPFMISLMKHTGLSAKGVYREIFL